MIDKNILFVASIITGKHDIVPNTKNITFFVNEFEDKELVPTSTKQNEDDILELSNSEEGLTISFLRNKIVFFKVFNSNTQTVSITDFCTYVIEIWSRINKKYSKSANRLGITSKVFFKELPEEDLQSIYSKIFMPFGEFNFDEPKAWTKESVSQFTRQIGDTSEELNIITELKRVQGSFNDNKDAVSFDKIELGIHINTIEENTDFRFGTEHINIVFDNMLELHTELTNLIIKHIK